MTVHAPPLTAPHAGPPQCVLPAGALLGEGPLWSAREQMLYWVDILSCALYRFDPLTGRVDHWMFEEEISALAERAAHPGLVVALRSGPALFDPARPATPPHHLHQPERHLPGNRFNDGRCDAQGRFWCGSMDFDCKAPTGSLYRCSPDGDCAQLDGGFVVSNGPAWSLDGRTLFFNDTVQGRTLAYDFDATTGALANRRLWREWARGDGLPDGMCVDAAGRLWIAHWGGACVSCHDPVTAQELCRVRLPVSQVTHCAFGGADFKTLYITSARTGLSAQQLQAEPLAGGLFAVTLDQPGLPAARFAG